MATNTGGPVNLNKNASSDTVANALLTGQNANMDKINDFNKTKVASVNASVTVKRCGNVVMVQGGSQGDLELPAKTYTSVGVVPVGYRPSSAIRFTFNTTGGDMNGQNGTIGTDGDIQLYIGAKTTYWGFTAVYII